MEQNRSSMNLSYRSNRPNTSMSKSQYSNKQNSFESSKRAASRRGRSSLDLDDYKSSKSITQMK